VTGWRLTDADTSCAIGDSCSTSELAHLFYNVFDGEIGIGGETTNSNFALFSGMNGYDYVTSSVTAPGSFQTRVHYAMYGFYEGRQMDHYTGNYGQYGMAVIDGDISAVPLPAAVWLFGSGLLGLIGIRSRKETA